MAASPPLGVLVGVGVELALHLESYDIDLVRLRL